MSSFGSGFSGGLMAGAKVASTGIDRYEKRQTDEATDSLFAAAMGKQELQAEGEGLAVEGEQRAGIMDMLGKASMGDITQAIVGGFAANGGKVNDQTYKLATGVASTLFGIKQDEQEWEQKNTIFGQKVRQNEASIANTYDTMAHRGRSGGGGRGGKSTSFMKEYEFIAQTEGPEQAKLFMKKKINGRGGQSIDDESISYGEDGAPDLKKIKVGGKLFKSLPDDVKRAALEARGIVGKPSPKAKGEFDFMGEPEESAAVKEPAWKKYATPINK